MQIDFTNVCEHFCLLPRLALRFRIEAGAGSAATSPIHRYTYTSATRLQIGPHSQTYSCMHSTRHTERNSCKTIAMPLAGDMQNFLFLFKILRKFYLHTTQTWEFLNIFSRYSIEISEHLLNKIWLRAKILIREIN